MSRRRTAQQLEAACSTDLATARVLKAPRPAGFIGGERGWGEGPLFDVALDSIGLTSPSPRPSPRKRGEGEELAALRAGSAR
jgi:hypothetical protein